MSASNKKPCKPCTPSRSKSKRTSLYTKGDLAGMLREFVKMSGHDQAVIYALIHSRATTAEVRT